MEIKYYDLFKEDMEKYLESLRIYLNGSKFKPVEKSPEELEFIKLIEEIESKGN